MRRRPKEKTVARAEEKHQLTVEEGK